MKTISAINSITLAQAIGTLTWDNSAGPSDGETVTIGTKTYTFKTALTPTEGEVLLNGGGDASLLNLIRAINHSGTPNTDYKCAAANAQVTAATSVTAHAFAVTAITGGLDGNSIVTTETSSHLSWGAATLTGGQIATISATVSNETFGLPARQISVAEYPFGNPTFSRAHRISDAAFFVIRAGSNSVALLLTAMSKIAVALETSLTFKPFINTQPVAATAIGTAAATGTLTSDNTNVSDAIAATGTLTSDNTNVADADTVTIDAKVYTFRVFFASATLTNDGSTPADGSTVVIGGKTYTWQTTLTNVDGHVLIGGSNTAAMTNLFHAINNSGGTSGTDYAAATTANTQVTATNPTGTTVVITAITAGTTGNSITTTQAGTSHGTWGGATMSGATGGTAEGSVNIGTNADGSLLNLIRAINHSGTAGTDYNCAAVHPTVSAATSVTSHAFLITAKTAGTAGNSIASTETSAHLSFGGTTLSSGAAAETVTVGGKTYTFKTALTPTEGEVLIGGNADASLLNLIRAINHTGTPGTDYSCAAANALVSAASSVTSHHFLVTALSMGLAGNNIVTTETSGHLSWGSGTLSGGTDSPATFTVAQTSELDVTYAWYESADGITFGSALTNAGIYSTTSTATLTLTPTDTTKNGYFYKCRITNTVGYIETTPQQLTVN